LADQPRMRPPPFFHFPITRQVAHYYSNFQWYKHMTIRRGQIRIIQRMFRQSQVKLLDSPIRSMGKDTLYEKRQGFYIARVAYLPIRSADANFPTAWVNLSETAPTCPLQPLKVCKCHSVTLWMSDYTVQRGKIP